LDIEETNRPQKRHRSPYHPLKVVAAEAAMIKIRKRPWKLTGSILLLWRELLKQQRI
jgi:hypothetical protein